MKGFRWIEQPRWLAVLTLAFALVPVWLAAVTYRDARRKDDRLCETSAEVLAEQLQNHLGRHIYFLGVLRNQARGLDDEALRSGKIAVTVDWKGKLPHLAAIGYAAQDSRKIMLRWKSEERAPMAKLGDDLAMIPGLAESLERNPDSGATIGCRVAPHHLLVLLAVPGSGSGGARRGFVVGWLDLESLCRDSALPLVRDQVLAARPLAGNASLPAGERRVTIRDGALKWEAGITQGARFSQQYGSPTPWLAFAAVGLSAVPLLGLVTLASRSAKLHAALAAEREVVRQQRFFTQSVSHEFRTPLGIIMSGTDLLDRYAEHLTPERKNEVLAEIKDNTRHMSGMVERVLLLGRIESGRFACTPGPVNLASLCHEIARKARTASHDECAITVSAADGEVMLDASLIGSILDNLLSNALKYSAPGQTVSLNAIMSGERIVFTVTDQGIGIPPEDLPSVCDPFHRCANVGEVPGSGLGLAIAQRCAALHGGTLTFESTAGRGTTATLTIRPAAVPDSTTANLS
jgi:signal transduction histidine kinase